MEDKKKLTDWERRQADKKAEQERIKRNQEVMAKMAGKA